MVMQMGFLKDLEWNGILVQEPPQTEIIQVSKVQSVNWQRRQNSDEAIKFIAFFVEMGYIRNVLVYQRRQSPYYEILICSW